MNKHPQAEKAKTGSRPGRFARLSLFRRRRNKSVGQSIVEFALVAPLLLLLIFGIIDIARLIQAQVTVNNAARQAARFAVTGYQERDASGVYILRSTSIISTAVKSLAGLPRSETGDPQAFGFYKVRLNPPDGGEPKEIVEVTIAYNVDLLTPLVNAILPRVTVKGFERSINEEWGAVQTFEHSNYPSLPSPLPTWTPYPTYTPTATWTPLPTSTNTRTPVVTATRTNTATSTGTATPTATATGTPTNTGSPTPTGTSTKTPTITLTPTITPTSTRTGTATPTGTSTKTPTITPTFTNTATPTRTSSPTKTSTPTNTVPPTPTNTYTPTPTSTPVLSLTIVEIKARKPDGNSQPMDFEVRVRDNLGNDVDDAKVSVFASNVAEIWSGTISSIGQGTGTYRECNAGSFSGNDGGGVIVGVSARKPGYITASSSVNATSGNLSECP